MLNVRAYLPSTEDFDSLPDTLSDDVSTDGENTYVSGIPEELIKPAEGSTQGNEDDGVITNMLQKQKKAEDTEEQYEESEEKKFEEEHKDDDQDTTSSDIGGGDQDAGTDEPVEGQNEDSVNDGEPAADEESAEEPEEDEDKDLQLAIESYSRLIRNADKTLTQQSADFLKVGIARLDKRLGVTTVSTEDFASGPVTARLMVSSDVFLTHLASLKKRLD
jgi:hypothetical protein